MSRNVMDNLPDDIWANVFDQLAALAITGAYESLKVSHVCRRWRNIARRLPRLWCNIHAPIDLKLLDIMLSRSRDFPLSLTCNFYASHVYEKIKHCLKCATPRLRQLTLSCSDPLRYWPAVKLLEPEMPRLESLEVRIAYMTMAIVTVPATNLARLQRLRLITYWNWRDVARCVSLTHLEVLQGDLSWQCPLSRPDSVVLALQAMPYLTHLHLHVLWDDHDLDVPLEGKVDLPNLRLLRLGFRAAPMTALLTAMSFPATTRLLLDVREWGMVHETDVQYLNVTWDFERLAAHWQELCSTVVQDALKAMRPRTVVLAASRLLDDALLFRAWSDLLEEPDAVFLPADDAERELGLPCVQLPTPAPPRHASSRAASNTQWPTVWHIQELPLDDVSSLWFSEVPLTRNDVEALVGCMPSTEELRISGWPLVEIAWLLTLCEDPTGEPAPGAYSALPNVNTLILSDVVLSNRFAVVGPWAILRSAVERRNRSKAVATIHTFKLKHNQAAQLQAAFEAMKTVVEVVECELTD